MRMPVEEAGSIPRVVAALHIELEPNKCMLAEVLAHTCTTSLIA